MKNLLDDPSSRSLAADMDRRLETLMKETGDSWEYRATTGDYKLWESGGLKQESQDLGVPYPGSDASAQKARRRRKKQ